MFNNDIKNSIIIITTNYYPVKTQVSSNFKEHSPVERSYLLSHP